MSDKLDTNEDGIVSNNELESAERKQELELREDKADSQRNMARAALAGIFLVIIIITGPWIETVRLEAISPILSTCIYAFAGIVGAYMGFTSWMQKNG
tara:strand:+ start:4318 stop:4611 length:294 start_codon:yes stop_codon:yes gene_type:complete